MTDFIEDDGDIYVVYRDFGSLRKTEHIIVSEDVWLVFDCSRSPESINWPKQTDRWNGIGLIHMFLMVKHDRYGEISINPPDICEWRIENKGTVNEYLSRQDHRHKNIITPQSYPSSIKAVAPLIVKGVLQECFDSNFA